MSRREQIAEELSRHLIKYADASTMKRESGLEIRRLLWQLNWETDRLPRKVGSYIVTTKTHSDSMGDVTSVHEAYFCNGAFITGESCEVLAWQPRPEPYEEDFGNGED